MSELIAAPNQRNHPFPWKCLGHFSFLTWFLLSRGSHPNGSPIGFAIFSRLTSVSSADRPCYICSKRPHLMPCIAVWTNSNVQCKNYLVSLGCKNSLCNTLYKLTKSGFALRLFLPLVYCCVMLSFFQHMLSTWMERSCLKSTIFALSGLQNFNLCQFVQMG